MQPEDRPPPLLRRALPADAEAIAALVRASYALYLPRMDREPAPMLADYHAVLREAEVLVLTEGDEVVGVIVYRPAADHLFIDNLAVAPGRQGHGLGRRLLVAAERRARTAGLPALRLYTNQVMAETLRFYARLGFSEIERRDEDGYARVYLEKPVET